jgi:hypothetical protein
MVSLMSFSVCTCRYGKQLVPMSKEDAEALKYEPEKGFQVLGFVQEARIPRHHFMKVRCLVRRAWLCVILAPVHAWLCEPCHCPHAQLAGAQFTPCVL